MTAPVSITPTAAPTAEKRKRDSLFLLAKMRLAGDVEAHDVRIRNLSEGGTMAEFARPVAADTAVELELRGIGSVAGRVAWYEEGRMGIAFDTAIDPKLARKPVGQGAKPRR
jgi:hypothetical protein